VWEEVSDATHHGLGQRVIATDVVDVPLLELRKLVVHASVADAGASPAV
jgi:protein involved in temperature-dependent protein secretion